ncbi:cyclin-dependent kinase inhibitor 1B-like isoform X1 [Entelurus aequoreus]|uniref:cyclin-dependent kinase inhibitor 1B-like isoform X1 n=2 Tax=Entelurus aequoreus TaxID=161455 RepID=UPI002B1E528B|nr:cyclin-dependent kinase inhibitor 1B-like isoform X1 [Entelurus aequoreus]
MILGDMAMDTSTSADSETACRGSIEAPSLKVGSVRRNLFGPVDHQQLRQDFQRLLHSGVDAANKRWNYDFRSDAPSPGPGVQWEELKCQDVPRFYHSCTVRPAAKKTRRRFSASPGDSSDESGSSSGSGDEYLEVATRRRCRLQKRKQLTIMDFFKVKKRKLLHYKSMTRQ